MYKKFQIRNVKKQSMKLDERFHSSNQHTLSSAKQNIIGNTNKVKKHFFTTMLHEVLEFVSRAQYTKKILFTKLETKGMVPYLFSIARIKRMMQLGIRVCYR